MATAQRMEDLPSPCTCRGGSISTPPTAQREQITPRAAGAAPSWPRSPRQAEHSAAVLKARLRTLGGWARARWWLLLLLLVLAPLFAVVTRRCARAVVHLFRWAEKRVDADSPQHMAAFLAISMVFYTGLPIPIVLQVQPSSPLHAEPE